VPRHLLNRLFHERLFLNADDGAASGAPPVESAPAEADAAPAEAEELDLDGELTQDSFDRAYVEKLRKEAAKYRTSARELEQKYQSVYDGFDDPEDVNYLIGLARKVYDDPASTAAEFEAIAKRIREATGVDITDDAPDSLDDIAEDKPLTMADLERIERERAVEAAERQIRAEAAELGYDLSTHQGKALLYIATNETKGDLKAAHEKLEAEREALKKEAIEEYLRSVEENANAFPPVSGGSGGSPAGSSGSHAPRDFKEASASALARLEAMVKQSGG